ILRWLVYKGCPILPTPSPLSCAALCSPSDLLYNFIAEEMRHSVIVELQELENSFVEILLFLADIHGLYQTFHASYPIAVRFPSLNISLKYLLNDLQAILEAEHTPRMSLSGSFSYSFPADSPPSPSPLVWDAFKALLDIPMVGGPFLPSLTAESPLIYIEDPLTPAEDSLWFISPIYTAWHSFLKVDSVQKRSPKEILAVGASTLSLSPPITSAVATASQPLESASTLQFRGTQTLFAPSPSSNFISSAHALAPSPPRLASASMASPLLVLPSSMDISIEEEAGLLLEASLAQTLPLEQSYTALLTAMTSPTLVEAKMDNVASTEREIMNERDAGASIQQAVKAWDSPPFVKRMAPPSKDFEKPRLRQQTRYNAATEWLTLKKEGKSAEGYPDFNLLSSSSSPRIAAPIIFSHVQADTELEDSADTSFASTSFYPAFQFFKRKKNATGLNSRSASFWSKSSHRLESTSVQVPLLQSYHCVDVEKETEADTPLFFPASSPPLSPSKTSAESTSVLQELPSSEADVPEDILTEGLALPATPLSPPLSHYNETGTALRDIPAASRLSPSFPIEEDSTLPFSPPEVMVLPLPPPPLDVIPPPPVEVHPLAPNYPFSLYPSLPPSFPPTPQTAQPDVLPPPNVTTSPQTWREENLSFPPDNPPSVPHLLPPVRQEGMASPLNPMLYRTNVENQLMAEAKYRLSPSLMKSLMQPSLQASLKYNPTMESAHDWEVNPTEVIMQEKIGSGGTSQVYRGFWRGTEVAVKVLTDVNATTFSEKTLTDFQRELKIMQCLRHPNLVLFMGAYIRQSPFAVVTEFCAGGTLFDILHRKLPPSGLPGANFLTWKQKYKLALDIARGLTYLHSSKPSIIHRDMKSLNILLAAPIQRREDVPLAKVADFGLSCVRITDTAQYATNAVGTYHWMAPEILAGKVYDRKVDVYSYGIVLYEIISGCLPYEEMAEISTPVQIGLAVCNGHRPDVRHIPASCPMNFRNLMTSCWAQDAKNRPSFDSIVSIISQLCQGM
ncbi:protein kinase domain-containing protein, partial [Cardiosporidium cionae]